MEMEGERKREGGRKIREARKERKQRKHEGEDQGMRRERRQRNLTPATIVPTTSAKINLRSFRH